MRKKSLLAIVTEQNKKAWRNYQRNNNNKIGLGFMIERKEGYTKFGCAKPKVGHIHGALNTGR